MKRLKSQAFSIILFFIISVSNSFGQEFKWLNGVGQWTDEYFGSMTTDNDGNLYLTGYAGSGTTFDDYITKDWGIFITKYNKEGKNEWVVESEGNFDTQTSGIATDKNGNVYIVGRMNRYSMILGGNVLEKGMLFAKIDKNGQVLWAKSIGDHSHIYANAIAVDSMNNVFIAGGFEWYINIGNDTLKSQKGYDIFLSKFDEDGNLIWQKRAGGDSDDYAYDLDLDKNGNVYLCGQYRQYNSNFGSFSFDNSNSEFKDFIAKYDSNGQAIWVESSYVSSNSIIDALVCKTDNKGNVYYLGKNYNTTVFQGRTMTKMCNYIRKLNPDGKLIWAKELPNYYYDSYGDGVWLKKMASITIDNLNSVIIAAPFQGTFAIDGNTLISDSSFYGGSSFDTYILKFNEIGYFQWFKKFGGNGTDVCMEIIYSNDRLFFGGHYDSEEVNWSDSILINNSGNNDKDIFFGTIIDTIENKCPINSPQLILNPDYLCKTDSINLICSYDYGSTYSFFQNEFLIDSGYINNIWLQKDGNYRIGLNAGTVCPDSTESLFIKSYEKPIININGDSILCNKDSIKLMTNYNLNYKYSWFNSNSILNVKNELIIKEPDTYYLEVSDDYCKSIDSITIISGDPKVQIESSNENFLCNGVTIDLNSYYDSNYTYNWSLDFINLGKTSQLITIDKGGFYELEVRNNYCTSYDSITIYELEKPNFTLKDTVLVNSFPINISIEDLGDSYYWYNSIDNFPISFGNEIEISEEGMYYLYGSNYCGFSIDSILIVLGTEIVSNNLQLMVYPNPFYDFIELKLNGHGESVKIEIFDLSSHLKYYKMATPFKDEKIILELDNIEKGVYFLKIASKNYSNVFKIVKY